MIFQFNPNHPLQSGPGRRRQSEEAKLWRTLHKIDPCVSKNLKRESAIMANLNHPTISVGNFYWCLVVDFVPWRQSLRQIGSGRMERFELEEELSRWLINCAHRFYDNDVNIVRSQWTWTWQRRKLLSRNTKEENSLLCSSILDPHLRSSSSLPKFSPSMQQVFVKFSCNDGGDWLQWWCRRWCWQ